MKHYAPFLAVLAVSLMGSTLIPLLKASETDKLTLVTISQPISVQGTTLPPGKYVLRLEDPLESQSVVHIFNADGTRLITTILAIHAWRQRPADRSEFVFYDFAAGQQAALHLWFYPGDNAGFEFVRPRHAIPADAGTPGN
jgi:hypothetical protein